MKSIKRALAIVIALSILMALAMPAFAADGKSYRRYKTYTCIGDGIAAGCGLQVVDVNRLIKQFEAMQQLTKALTGKGSKKLQRMMRSMGGMGGMNGFKM